MNLNEFIDSVCREYQISRELLFSPSRVLEVVDARRKIAFHLYYDEKWMVPKIAVLLGKSRKATRLGRGFMKFNVH